MEAEYETAPGLPSDIITFDLGWPWTVLDLGHKTCASNISNAMRDRMYTMFEM